MKPLRPRLAAALASLAIAAAPGPASADEAAAERARALYAQGSERYAAGDYAEAARHFEAAYEASKTPALLFNIAQAHRMRGPEACEEALSAYERYRDQDRTLSNRAELQERIAEMRGCVEAKRAAAGPAVGGAAAAPTPPAVVARPASSQAQPPRLRGGWAPPALVIAGALVGAAGGALYLRTRLKYEDAKKDRPYPEGTFDGWQRAERSSYALLAAGGAAFGGGLVWWILRDDAAAPIQVNLGLRRLAISGRF